ncbi:MAG: hypothetical protein ACE15C_07640 [Phycisphaerae bacterium]
MCYNGLRVLFSCGAVALAACVAAAQTTNEAVELGSKHIDLNNGFSIRSPAGADRQRTIGQTQLVSWVGRDAKTGAVAWTLTVQKVTEAGKIDNLKVYSGKVLDKLKAQQDFAADPVTLGQVDGKDCFDIKGTLDVPDPAKRAKIRFWQRQVWIQTDGTQFLIVMITGNPADKDKSDAILTAVLKTVTIIDPKAVAAQREEHLKAGKELLAGLTMDKLVAAASKEPRWFLLKLNDKPVGFMAQAEGPSATAAGPKGLVVKSCIYLKLDANPDSKLVKRTTMFVSSDLASEEWSETRAVGAAEESEKGARQGAEITCTLKPAAGKAVDRKARSPSESCLPRAVGMLLPRLVDLGKPCAYAFLSYSPQDDIFETRTFTVEGPAAAGDTKRVRATDQASAVKEPATYILDDKGAVLLVTTPDGLTMEAAKGPDIEKQFAEAKALRQHLTIGEKE